ncbi:MAG: dioxygenase [Ardenticatenia bacterium]|nr:dioxygenase [Ardenticatenia bacterium]
MVDFMTPLPSQLAKLDAILVISAHWEESAATLLGAQNPPIFYDYYGFPKEAYEIIYPAPGHPALEERIAGLLEKDKIPTRIDTRRGFDHGSLIPLKLIYPEADIAPLQLSLLHGLNSAAYVALGKALRGLLSENILVIGSGLSFHNRNAFLGQAFGAADPANEAFQNWLIETCTGPLSQSKREQRLITQSSTCCEVIPTRSLPTRSQRHRPRTMV